MPPKKHADQWFQEYGASHQDPVNKSIHWICVPLISASLLALCWDLPTPSFMRQVPYLNWATLVVALSMVFYIRLSISLALGMLAFSLALLAGISAYERLHVTYVWQAAIVVFVLAWIGQFIGHSIEGKKPSFVDDLKFLLIGPVWLLGFIYRRLGIRY